MDSLYEVAGALWRSYMPNYLQQELGGLLSTADIEVSWLILPPEEHSDEFRTQVGVW